MTIATQSIQITASDSGFKILLDTKPLTTPAGLVINLPTKRLARSMVAELITTNEVNPAHLGLYCLASTQFDFTDQGKGIPVEGLPKILLFDPALHALPTSDSDFLEPVRSPIADFLGDHGLIHPEIPTLPEDQLENWLAEAPIESKRNIEGILRLTRDIFEKLSKAQQAVLINAGKVHRSFFLGLLLVQNKLSTAEYAAAVMAALRIHPLAWNNIETNQYRAAFEEVRLQADSMRIYLDESHHREAK